MNIYKDDGFKLLGTVLVLILLAYIVFSLFNGSFTSSNCPEEAVQCNMSDCGCCVYAQDGSLIDYCDAGACPSGYVMVNEQCCNIDNLEACIDPEDACINPDLCSKDNDCCSGFKCENSKCVPCGQGSLCDSSNLNSCCEGYVCNEYGRCESLSCDSKSCETPGQYCQVCDSSENCIQCDDNSICTDNYVCKPQGNCPEGFYECDICPSGCCDALSDSCYSCVGQPCEEPGQPCQLCDGPSCGYCEDSKCVATENGYMCVSNNDACPEGTHQCDNCGTGCCSDLNGECQNCEGQPCEQVGQICQFCAGDSCVECENTVCMEVDGNLTCVNSNCPHGTVPNENCEGGCGLANGSCPGNCEGDSCDSGDIVYDSDDWTCIVSGEGNRINLEDLESGNCKINSYDTNEQIACTNGEIWKHFTIGEFNCFRENEDIPSWVYDVPPGEECNDCLPKCASDGKVYDLNGDGNINSDDIQLFIQTCGVFEENEDGIRVCSKGYDERTDFNNDGALDENDFKCMSDIAEKGCCSLIDVNLKCKDVIDLGDSWQFKAERCFEDNAPQGYQTEVKYFESHYLGDHKFYSYMCNGSFNLTKGSYYIDDQIVSKSYSGCILSFSRLFGSLVRIKNLSSVSAYDCHKYDYVVNKGVLDAIKFSQGDGLEYYYNKSCLKDIEGKSSESLHCKNSIFTNGVVPPMFYDKCISLTSSFCSESEAKDWCEKYAMSIGCGLCKTANFNCNTLENCDNFEAVCNELADNAYQRCTDYLDDHFDELNCMPCHDNSIQCGTSIQSYRSAFCKGTPDLKEMVYNKCIQILRSGYDHEITFGNLMERIIREYIENKINDMDPDQEEIDFNGYSEGVCD